jgi:hypothetical protein
MLALLAKCKVMMIEAAPTYQVNQPGAGSDADNPGNHLQEKIHQLQCIASFFSVQKLAIFADVLDQIREESGYGDITLVLADGQVQLVKKTNSYK